MPPIVCPGFLEAGEPYTWDESREDGIMEWVRTHGIDQFLAMWEKVKAIRCDDLKWGDELEYSILSANGDDGTVRCKLRGAEILAEVRKLDYAESARHGRAGIVGERTSDEIGVHAIRGGDVVGDHTVIYAAPGERLELTHKASSRDTFARGALRAAKWAAQQPAGLYDMQDVLGLK